MKLFLKILSLSIFSLVIIFTGAFVYYSAVTQGVDLDPSKLENATSACSVYDGNGQEITLNGGVAAENELPENLRNAFVAIEDKRFYSHKGVDYKGMARAVINNVKNGKIKEGASTITQQLVKNVYLSGEKTLKRKLKEIKLARQLEKKYSKTEILNLYLNKIYYGEGSYGVVAAAKTYFDKDAKDLSLSECATLAAIIKAPSTYTPYKNYELCLKRRNLVLKEMFSQGFIVETDYNAAINEAIVLTDKNSDNISDFSDEAICEAIEILQKENAEQLNGYKIYTSVRSDLQKELPVPTISDTAKDFIVLVTDNKSGIIIAYKSTVGQIKRCPASAAKPWLVYAPAIEENYVTEATKILDEKTNFGGYTPSNAGKNYQGYVSVKESLSKSLNVPAVKIANSLGMKKIKEYARKLNVSFTNDDLSVSLGNLSGGMTLKELTSAYSPFFSNGYYKKVGFITKIINPDGKIVYEGENDDTVKVFSDSTCFIINDMLKETVKSGTAKKLSALNLPVYAKTGTNGDEHGNSDAYCIAYTPDFTVSVWMGNANGALMSNSITGGSEPTLAAKEIFSCLYADRSVKDFEVPKSVKYVEIDRNEYEKNQRMSLPDISSNENPSFWFTLGTEPTKKYNNIVTPIIKDYKITVNNGNILICINADSGVSYTLTDKNNNVSLFGQGNSTLVIKTDAKGVKYNLTLTPYSRVGDEITFGKEIKLPSVKSDGN